jgi:hypothetical protein
MVARELTGQIPKHRYLASDNFGHKPIVGAQQFIAAEWTPYCPTSRKLRENNGSD